MRNDQIALQLYTVREQLAADLAGTLRAVAGAGYRAVELAGLPPVEPGELAALLAANDLRPVASHESIEALRDGPGAVAERLGILGCPRAIVPWLDEEERATTADVRRVAAELGEIAGALGDAGIQLGYHNHTFEFGALEGTTIWDVLLDTLPAAVEIELDVFWASVAGRDPIEAIRALDGRVKLLHMKDRESGPDTRDAPPGGGILPWPAIVSAGRAAGVEWYVVEQDHPRDALNDVAAGRSYLAGLAA